MVLTPLQKGAIVGAGVAAFLGWLSLKARAEKECEEGSIEYSVCVDATTGETTTVVQPAGMVHPEHSVAVRECREGKWVDLHPILPISWCWTPPPPPPSCEEGTTEVLEYEDDGVTPYMWRECINGGWVYYTQTWVSGEECTPGEKEIFEYCPDNITIKRERVCAPEGVWYAEEEHTCPSGWKITVMDADTQLPLSGVNVSLPDLGLSYITGADGLCTFIVEPGGVNLCVTKDGYRNVMASLGDCFGTDAGAHMTVWLESTMLERARFEGDVKGRQKGDVAGTYITTPLPDATVTVVNDNTGKTYNVPVDANGYFYGLVGNEGEHITATFSAPNWVTQSTGGYLPLITNITLLPTAEATIYYARIYVHADTWGIPSIYGANVSATNVSTGETSSCLSECALPLVPGTYDMTASADGYVSQTQTVVVTRSMDVRFYLTPFECSPGETKCAGATEPYHPGNLYACGTDGHWYLVEQDNVDCISAYLGGCATGQAHCLNVRGISGQPDSYDYWFCENGVWVLGERNSTKCGYPEPEPPPEGNVTITGHVYSKATGEPIEGVKVRFCCASSSGETLDTLIETYTDANGDFTINYYMVQCECPGFNLVFWVAGRGELLSQFSCNEIVPGQIYNFKYPYFGMW